MIVTKLTEAFGLQHPIVLAPMGGVIRRPARGGRIECGRAGARRRRLRRWRMAVARVGHREGAARGHGASGFITWSIGVASVLDLALAQRPHAFMLSFGDPRPHATAIKARAAS